MFESGRDSFCGAILIERLPAGEDVHAAMDAGMQAHIAKPIDIGALTQTLRSVLRS